MQRRWQQHGELLSWRGQNSSTPGIWALQSETRPPRSLYCKWAQRERGSGPATDVQPLQETGIPELETYPGLPQMPQRKATPLETTVMAAAASG